MPFYLLKPCLLLWAAVLYCCLLSAQPLSVDSSGHYLLDHTGTPFFWMGDTAWELLHRLDREEMQLYLDTRHQQGFNVVQTVALYEIQRETPNAYGDFPMEDLYGSTPALSFGDSPSDELAYDYWDHLEYFIEAAREKGLLVALLPCWGEYVSPRKQPRANFASPQDGYYFGWFIGDRFKTYNDNLIWMLGGDRLPDEARQSLEIWRAMAEGITDGVNGRPSLFDGQADYSSTFMTFHCYQSSSRWFHEDDWIDFHSWGSYHGQKNFERAYRAALYDWRLPDPKPTLNSEPAYELFPVNYEHETVSQGYFDEYDMRQIAYWSVFSGSCGHTYGGNGVWQMYAADQDPSPPNANYPYLVEWKDGLNLSGASQMRHLRRLVETFPFTQFRPNEPFVAAHPFRPETGSYTVALTSPDAALVYSSHSETITLDWRQLDYQRVYVRWYDPRTGLYSDPAQWDITEAFQQIDPPGDIMRGNDWVLVIEKMR